MIRIAIADDHQLLTDALKSHFAGVEDIQVAFIAPNGKVLVQLLEKKVVDVVLLDLNMPILDGFGAAQIIQNKFPDIGIIVMTMNRDNSSIRRMYDLGARGYLLKDSPVQEFEDALRSVNAGDTFYSAKIKDLVLQNLTNRKPDKIMLTRREKEVLQLICQGLTSPEIAERLIISTHTVISHRKNLLNKLEVNNVVSLVRKALEMGFSIDP